MFACLTTCWNLLKQVFLQTHSCVIGDFFHHLETQEVERKSSWGKREAGYFRKQGFFFTAGGMEASVHGIQEKVLKSFCHSSQVAIKWSLTPLMQNLCGRNESANCSPNINILFVFPELHPAWWRLAWLQNLQLYQSTLWTTFAKRLTHSLLLQQSGEEYYSHRWW